MQFVLTRAAMPTPRARHRAFKAKSGAIISSTYNPKNYTEYLQVLCGDIKAQNLLNPTLMDRVYVRIVVTLKRPKTTKLAAPKPDVDNYAKGVLDAMTRAEVWADDTQVVHLECVKRWGDADRIAVEVNSIN